MKEKKRTLLTLLFCAVISICLPGLCFAEEDITLYLDPITQTLTDPPNACRTASHNWSDWIITEAPTCGLRGLEARTCSVCGAEETITISSTHDHQMTASDIPATCLSGGYTEHTCSVCGYGYTDNETPPIGHCFGDWSTVSEASCAADGTEIRTCSSCGAQETRSIPATGNHQMEDTVVPATCTGGGYTEHRCSVCGYSYTDSETGVLGHDYYGVLWTVVEPATCSEDGMKNITCARCGITETLSIPATGKHKLVNSVTAPTCTGEGYTEHTCSVCGYSYTDSYKPQKDHSFSAWTTTRKATCLEEGEKTRTCSKCGAVETQAITGSHSMESKTVRPTCTSGGYTEHTCTVCGYSYRDSEKPVADHSFSDYSWKTTIAPSCFTDGEKTRKCRYCDATESCPIPAYGEHVFDSWRTEESPTCITDGVKTRSCRRCGAVEEESFSDLSKHKFHYTTVPSTCLEEGYKQYVCDYCGFTYIDDILPKSNHRWGNWKLTKHRDCGHDGEESRTCTICGKTETRVLPKTGNHWIDDRIVEPTCQAKGYTEHKCWLCGYTTKDHETEIVDCSFGPWTPQKQVTCVEDGTSIRTCKWCGKTETRTDTATGVHNYITTYVHQTCTEEGYALHKCSMCGLEIKDNICEPLGHHIVSDNNTATCQHDGYFDWVCDWCGEIFETHVYSPGGYHAEEKVVIAPTRTEHGAVIYKCKYCDTILTERVQHFWIMTGTVLPSEEDEDGCCLFTCSVCGETLEDGKYDKYGDFIISLSSSPMSETEKVQAIAQNIGHEGTCLSYSIRVQEACRSAGLECQWHNIWDDDAQEMFGYTDEDRQRAMETGWFPNGVGNAHVWVTCVADGETYSFFG